MSNLPGSIRVSIIPRSMRGRNLRAEVEPYLWDMIAQAVKRRDGSRCQCCGYQADLEAHEAWRWDWLAGVQRLEKIITLCSHCHSAVHLDLTREKEGRGAYRLALMQLGWANRWGWWRLFAHVQLAGLLGHLREWRGPWRLATNIDRIAEGLGVPLYRDES